MVAGSNLITSRRVVRELVGSEVFERALAALTKEERAAFMDSTVLSWVPVALIDRSMEEIARAAGITPEELVVNATRIAQAEMLHTIYRVLMRITTDEALIGRTNTFYAKVYDTGTLSSVFPAPGRATVTLAGWPSISSLQIAGLGAGIETTLRCAGRKEPRVSGKRSPDGVVYTCSWRR